MFFVCGLSEVLAAAVVVVVAEVVVIVYGMWIASYIISNKVSLRSLTKQTICRVKPL